MKKIKYLYFILLFTLFIPKVYAFTYELQTSVDNTLVSAGTVKEIKVSLNNIQGTDDGIMSCSLNIQFDSNILLDSQVRTLESWTMTTGKMYLFDTGNAVMNNSSMFIIPVKVNGVGAVKLVDIVCSDGNTNASVNDKTINFTILTNNEENNNQGSGTNNNNNNGSNNNQENSTDDADNSGDVVIDGSNCDLTNITLSEGTIQFDSSVTEYSIKVSSIDNLEVTPVLADSSASYTVERNISEDGSSFVITVNSMDGNSKVYTLYVTEDASANDTQNDNKKGNNYTPIFIGIICVLVLVNILRIIKSKKK